MENIFEIVEISELQDRIKLLTKRLHDKGEFITKLNGECTELHQRIITLGRTFGAKIDYWRDRCDRSEMPYRKLKEQIKSLTECLHDKNDSVTKPQDRVEMLVSTCDAFTEAIKKVEEWRDYWKKGYSELYTELQDTAKALSEANEKLHKLARRDGYKDLEEEAAVAQERYDRLVGDFNKWRVRCDKFKALCQDLKAKVKRLEEEAVVAKGSHDLFAEEKKDLDGIVATLRELRDCDQKQMVEREERIEGLLEDRDFWRKAHHRVNQELQNLKSHKLVVAGTEDVEALKKELKAVQTGAQARIEFLTKGYKEIKAELETEKGHSDFLKKLVKALVGADAGILTLYDAHEFHRKYLRDMAELEAKRNILVKNIDISKTEQVIRDLVEECRDLRAQLAAAETDGNPGM